MDVISWVVSFLYSLFLVSFPLIIYALFFSKGPLNLPPGSTGWAIVGETIHFRNSGPDKFISDRMMKYSTQVFRTSMLGENVAVFCGPLGNKFVFNDQTNVLAFWFPPLIKQFIGLENGFLERFYSGSGGLLHVFHAILKNDSVKQFIPIFNETAKDHVENEWKHSREVKVFPLSKLFCFSLACRFLMGNLDKNEIKTLASLYDEVNSGFFSIPINLPGTTYRRAINAGKTVHERVSNIIQRRRKNIQESENGQGLDLLSQVLKTAPDDTNEEAHYISDLRSMIVGTLFAATSPPASAITFTLNYLTKMSDIHNQVYQALVIEQMDIVKSKGEEYDLTWDDFKKMEYTWNVVREVLRVTTPITLGGFREVKSDFTYAGFTIPKGWKILWTSQTSHKDPKYFKNPEEFNPSRFEGSVREPYSYVPFGGGREICPGRDFFKFYMLTFIHIVVTKFELEKLDPNEGIKYEMTPFPKNGFPVRLIHR